MYDLIYNQLQLVATFMIILVVVQLLKRRGIFNDSHQPVFDRLVTEFALPAIIFSGLVSVDLENDWVIPSLILFLAIFICGLIAYGICRYFSLSPGKTGAVIIVSSVGSTATFASPLIEILYGTGSEAMALSLLIGEFGAAVPFFTIGVLIVFYFGAKENKRDVRLVSVLKDFVGTPIFISFFLGLFASIICSYFNLLGSGIIADIFRMFFTEVSGALQLLVWIAIGLLIRPCSLKKILPFLVLVVFLQMILQPVLVLCFSSYIGQSVIVQEVLFLMAAIPSGAIAAVISDRYGCDGTLAATLVVGTYLLSLITVPFMLIVLN